MHSARYLPRNNLSNELASSKGDNMHIAVSNCLSLRAGYEGNETYLIPSAYSEITRFFLFFGVKFFDCSRLLTEQKAIVYLAVPTRYARLKYIPLVKIFLEKREGEILNRSKKKYLVYSLSLFAFFC